MTRTGVAWVMTTNLAAGEPTSAWPDARHPFRLRNAAGTADAFLKNRRALLLRNAFVDTGAGSLGVPGQLRSEDPGAFVVQAAGRVDAAFRAQLSEAGLQVVSYIPNNALLVAGDKAAVEKAAASPLVGAVLPFEPYFKLDPALIFAALNPAGQADLRVVVTATDPAAAADQLANLGAKEVRRERGPFGALITVEVPASGLAALAQLRAVQLVEPSQTRRLANDRSGVILGSYTNADNTGPFLGLTGKGVLVNLNDSGVDATHPDLSGRVLSVPGATNAAGANLLTDPDGHGTHVAGILAGNGAESATLANPAPQGSAQNANFQGKASAATLYVLPVDLIQGPPSGDDFLQEQAALAPGRPDLSEPLISNNSWAYTSGFGPDTDYDSHSASYDAAVRDALPGTTGDQPILYVFAAGNFGNGGDNGIGGDFDSVSSPGNAKNVITVGALESARMLTNTVIYDSNGVPVWAGSVSLGPIQTNTTYYTNQVFLGLTDSDTEVASFSSRGNVGIGTEGDSGRFKPDVVAPGVFTISTRSALWQLTNDIPPSTDPVTYDLFADLERETAPWYRYESGTSMATPAVSGMLAQMQEFFRGSSNGPSPSAAGYKALIINSATVTSTTYNPDPHGTENYAGWGEPYLPFALTPNVGLGQGTGRGQYVIQSDDPAVSCADGGPCIGLATGDSVSFRVTLNTNALAAALHFTLVWTDPPGNPAAAAKLVNDLDMVVSNEITGDVYVGNYYDAGSGLSAVSPTGSLTTNGAAPFDRVNNVERVDLNPSGSSSFVVTIAGHQVNVNARRDHPDATVQDFALAIRSDYVDPAGALSGTAALTPAAGPAIPGFGAPAIVGLTNGVPLLTERVGANSPLINGPYGQSEQWRFYVFTNSPGVTTNGDLVLTNGSNVVFVTFPVGGPNAVNPTGHLSRARTNEADIDLYVSRDASLTNLNPAAIAAAYKSVSRGASELIFFTNSPVNGEIYYIGVKSEDQQAAEYGFVGISTADPLTSLFNGAPRPIAIPLIQPIPDGTPDHPGKGVYMAISTVPRRLRLAVAGVTTSHEHFEDLIGTLSHGGPRAVLNNHSRLGGRDFGTNISVLYDDTRTVSGALPTDGPGSLISFLGYGGSGAWFLTTVDNAKGNIGRINRLDLGLTPNDFGETLVSRCVGPGGYDLEVIVVPPTANRLTVTLTNMMPALPLEVYVRREDIPDVTNTANDDKFATIEAPGGSISVGLGDVPPLLSGRYFILIHNPNSVQVCFRIRGHLDYGLDSKFTRTFSSASPVALPDQARISTAVEVNDGRPVTAVQVGLLAQHPRESDLAVRLVNPQGSAAMVVENRGSKDGTGFGGLSVSTNGAFTHVALTWNRALHHARLFVNGEVSAEGDFPDYTPSTTNAIFWAADPSGALVPTPPVLSLDDFGLWKTDLLPQDVQGVYQDGLTGAGKTGPDRNLGLVALWPLDGDGGDVFGNNNISLLGFHRTTAGQIGQAVQFASPTALGRVDPSADTDVGQNDGFTLDGWIDLSSNRPGFVAGWGSRTVVPSPAILANASAPLGNGYGSVSVILGYSTNGQPRVLSSGAGLAVPNATVTNRLYAVFQDDTNNPVSKFIKFASPPFSSDVRSRLLAVSDFETNQDGFLFLGTLVDGWTIDAGAVQQFHDGDVAFTGLGFIGLRSASISRSFDVDTNRTYTVGFAHRLPANPNGKPAGFRVYADGALLDTVIPDVLWQTNVYVFNPTNSPLVLSFQTLTNSADSVLLDDFRLVETSSSIYLPEEPFAPLLGNPGLGSWGLEVNDTRAGEVGSLASWQLTLTFGPTNSPAVTLTNGVCYQTNVVGGGIQYFIVNVPPEATAANQFLESLTGGPLNLLFDQNGLPDGNLSGDYQLLSGVTTGQTASLVPTLIPPLVPGQRYYLGVQNSNPGDSNVFNLCVNFAIPITPLTNGVIHQATNQNKGLIDYYSFNVTKDDIKVLFSVSNMTAGVHLVVGKSPNLPTRSKFDFAGVQSGSSTEYVAVDVNNQPVALSEGLWYLGVYSAGTPPLTPIGYTIAATAYTDGVPLVDGVPLGATDVAGNDYFYIDVPSGAFATVFSLTNLSRNADLYVKKGQPVPGPSRYDYSSVNFGTVDESISILTNQVPVALSPGRWYVAVVPVDPAPIRYTVVATNHSLVNFIPLTNGVPVDRTLPAGIWVELYGFTAPTNTSAILFELYNRTTPAGLYVAEGSPPSFSPPAFASVEPGTAAELIVIRKNSATNDLVGTYYVEVRGTNAVSGTYSVRAVTDSGGLLVSGQDTIPVPYSNPGAGVPLTEIRFNSVPGEFYELEYLLALPPNLTPAPWIPLPPPVAAPGISATLPIPLDPIFTTNSAVYFRILQTPAP